MNKVEHTNHFGSVIPPFLDDQHNGRQPALKETSIGLAIQFCTELGAAQPQLVIRLISAEAEAEAWLSLAKVGTVWDMGGLYCVNQIPKSLEYIKSA